MNYNKESSYNNNVYYNSSLISIFINVSETIRASDSSPYLIAVSILNDGISIKDFIYNYVLLNKTESFNLNDALEYKAIFELMDQLGMKESFVEVLVFLLLSDSQELLDEIRLLNALINKEENLNVYDYTDINAIIKLAESNGITDIEKIFALILENDRIGLIDREPRRAISDFIIGKSDDFDPAYDWIFPFDMKVDWRNSNIQIMPQAESSYIDMPGVDGSIIENTIYKNRLFSIVAFSELGLTIAEKEEMKRDIAQILDATKNNPKKLTFQNSETSFDIIYSGSAEISEGPSYVKATIPLEAGPYGYPLFEQEVFGTGLLVNDGDLDVGCVHKISAGAINPSFQLGNITYTWSGTVPEDSTLVIDHNNYTCYIETVEGNRTNEIDKLTGEFQTIPRGSSMAITALGDTGEYLLTVLKEKIIW